VHGRGEDLLRIDDDLDADPFQFSIARHEVLPGGRGDGERRFAVAGRHRFAHFRLRLGRVQKQDIGARGDERLQPRQRLIEVAGGSRVGAGEEQNALFMAGLDGRAAAQDRGLALDHQLGPAMAERPRPGFVLDQHCGGAAPGVSADRLLHPKRVAIPGVAVGQPQHVRRGGNAALDRVGHFRSTQQVHVGHGQTHRGDAGAGDEAGAEAGFLDQPGAHAVAATRHNL